jgi:hypothetical protein
VLLLKKGNWATYLELTSDELSSSVLKIMAYLCRANNEG